MIYSFGAVVKKIFSWWRNTIYVILWYLSSLLCIPFTYTDTKIVFRLKCFAQFLSHHCLAYLYFLYCTANSVLLLKLFTKFFHDMWTFLLQFAFLLCYQHLNFPINYVIFHVTSRNKIKRPKYIYIYIFL